MVAVGALLKARASTFSDLRLDVHCVQATKGVSQLYDTIESLLQKVRDYVERIGIYMQPATPPSPPLMRILLDILVRVLSVLATVTTYCDRAAERHSMLRKAKDVLSVRTSKSFLRVIINIVTHGRSHRGLHQSHA